MLEPKPHLRGKRAKIAYLPPDATPEEYELLSWSVCNIYQKVDDPIDKFIISFCFELNYTQRMAAMSLGVSDGCVSKRIEKIRAKLSKGKNKPDELEELEHKESL